MSSFLKFDFPNISSSNIRIHALPRQDSVRKLRFWVHWEVLSS